MNTFLHILNRFLDEKYQFWILSFMSHLEGSYGVEYILKLHEHNQVSYDIKKLSLLKRHDRKFKFVSLYIQPNWSLTILFLEKTLTFKTCLLNTKYLLVMCIHLKELIQAL